MAGSGVHVQDEVSEVVSSMRKDQCYRYIILKLTDDMKEVMVCKKSTKDATYAEFEDDLKTAEAAGECRYAVYDYSFSTQGGVAKAKLVFLAWSPENAKVKQKMVYSATKEAVKKKFGTMVNCSMQATDHEEMNEKAMENCVKKWERA